MRSAFLAATAVLIATLGLPAAAQDVPAAAPAQPASPAVLPGTPASAFATVHGRALGPSDEALPQAVVRLRDVRSGRAVAVQMTNAAGGFAFRNVDPGSYIIELLGRDQSIRATSALISVNAAESLLADVKLLSRRETFASFLKHNVPQAAAVAAAAAAAGVLAVQSTTDVSPR